LSAPSLQNHRIIQERSFQEKHGKIEFLPIKIGQKETFMRKEQDEGSLYEKRAE
jgi:hypothetical protein